MNSDSDSVARRPPRLRERLREVTSEAILDAAEQAFAREGPKARMESIAGLAGIAVGTVYNHFADREALWAALCRSRREALLVRVDAALEEARALPFGPALHAFLDAFVAHWSAHHGFLAVLAQAEPVGGLSPRSGSKERTMVGELLDRAASLVRRGVEEGALHPEGAGLYPVLLMGMIRGVLFHHLDPAAPAAAQADVDRLVDVFLHGASTAARGARRR